MINSQILFTAEHYSQKIFCHNILHTIEKGVSLPDPSSESMDNQLTAMKERKERNTATSKISKAPS